MNIAEQLKQFEAKREALDARLEEIMQKAADEGRTLEDDESEEHSDLTAELKAVDEHLTRLRAMEKRQAERAQPVDPVVVKNTTTGSDARGGAIHVRQNLPPGVEFARYAICVALGHKNQVSPIDVAAARYPDNPRIANYIKAQVAAGTTSHTTWAAPLAQADNQFVGDFVDFLRPMTILGKFGVNGVPATRSVPFNVTIPGQTSGGSGYWVGQGKAKPLTSFNFQRTTFPFTKVANIAVITDELLRFSSPSAEGLVRDSLAAALQERLDTDFIDPAITEVAGVNPASVTSGAAGIDSAGTDADGVRADVKALVDAFIAANIPLTTGVWVMPNRVALSLSLMLNALGQPEFPTITMNGGTFFGMPVITSEYVPTAQGSPEGDMVALVAASEIWVADDGGADVAVSREASLEMATDPTMASAGVGSPEAPTEVTTVSMFQTNSIAIRAEREIHWKLRRSAAVQYVNSVAYA